MKKNIISKYIYSAMGLLMMASCSNDLSDDGGKIMENESTTYVRISLVGDISVTRADEEYENATGDESAVKSILLTFFDAGRNYVGQTTINVNENAEEVEVPGHENTVERILTVVAPVTLPENVNYPRYVLAYVNPTSASSDLSLDKLEDVMKIIRPRSAVSHTGYRTMNNSVFYNETTGYTRYATDLDFTKQFFSTMDEAKAASDDATITITVERMEAKVRLSTPLAEINVSPVDKVDGNNSEVQYSLEFVPEAWFVNATEKRSFLVKNYRSTRENYRTGHATFPSSDFGMSFSALQEAFKMNNSSGSRWNEINNQGNLRSFWAIDPTYFIEGTNGEFYPDVSYDVKYTENGVNINPGTETEPTEVYPLEYRSYANVLKEWKEHKSNNYVKFNETVKTHEYVLENTMSLLTLNSTHAMASMTSVVLVGHYMIKNVANQQVVFDGNTTDRSKSFYIRHDGNDNLSVMLSDTEAINSFLERTGSSLFVQTVDQAGNKVEGSYEALRAGHVSSGKYGVSYDDFELVYPKANITNGTKLSEQWRTLVLKKKNGAYNNNIYVYDAALNEGAGGYKNITEEDMPQLTARLYSTFGVVERFNTGKAYFNVPLRHIWGANKKLDKFEAKNVVLGDYGVVRNHIYDLSINKITGLGTGIGNPDQPIVPPTKNDQYYISTRLNILQWRLVKQNVDL